MYRKTVHGTLKSCFFMILAKKITKAFPKHKDISESSVLNWYIFVALTNQKLLLLLKWRLEQSFRFDLEKLIEYWTSAVNIVSSNPCVGPIPRNEKYFSLLSILTVEFISAAKIWTFLPMTLSGNEKSERNSNPFP